MYLSNNTGTIEHSKVCFREGQAGEEKGRGGGETAIMAQTETRECEEAEIVTSTSAGRHHGRPTDSTIQNSAHRGTGSANGRCSVSNEQKALSQSLTYDSFRSCVGAMMPRLQSTE